MFDTHLNTNTISYVFITFLIVFAVIYINLSNFEKFIVQQITEDVDLSTNNIDVAINNIDNVTFSSDNTLRILTNKSNIINDIKNRITLLQTKIGNTNINTLSETVQDIIAMKKINFVLTRTRIFLPNKPLTSIINYYNTNFNTIKIFDWVNDFKYVGLDRELVDDGIRPAQPSVMSSRKYIFNASYYITGFTSISNAFVMIEEYTNSTTPVISATLSFSLVPYNDKSNTQTISTGFTYNYTTGNACTNIIIRLGCSSTVTPRLAGNRIIKMNVFENIL
jgi:hypothetical protein